MKPPNEKIVILETQMTQITKDISEIKSDIRLIKDSLTFRQIDDQNFTDRLRRLESSSSLWKWLSPSLAAVLGSILTFLIIEFFRTRGV